MQKQTFQPISVKSPNQNPFLFNLRCLVDLQLKTIVDFLKAELERLPAGQLIDIGAGESPWKCWLGKQITYKGIDIAYANEFGMSQRSSDVILYDGRIMPFENNSFDSAICVEVLEHADNPEFLLREITRILRPGAVLLLTVPWSARRHHIPHDYHRFTKERLKNLFEDTGYKIDFIKERGNDYCAITNKLIVIIIRNIKTINFKNIIYIFPLILFIGFFAFIMLLVSHITLLNKTQNEDDPLGYFCKLTRI